MQKSERQKCIDDPVYFYENYFLVKGKKPGPLDEMLMDKVMNAITYNLDKYFPKELGTKKLRIKPAHAETLKDIYNHHTLHKVYTEKERKKLSWNRARFDEVDEGEKENFE